MTLMVACGYQPAPQPGMNKCAGKQLPAHMIGHTHKGHDRKNQAEHPDMDRHQKNQRRNNDSAGDRLNRMKAHRSPCGWRAAGMVHGMRDPEQCRAVHPAMRPIKPRVMRKQI